MKIHLSLFAAAAMLLGTQAAFAQEPPWDCQYQAQAKALQAMQGSANVTVDIVEDRGDPEYIRFRPNNETLNKAFIIQPGGGVDPRAYAVQALAFAERGYRTYIMGYDLCLPILEVSKADIIFQNDTEIQDWPVAMGGHSLGGVVSVKYIIGDSAPPPIYRGLITGLALWASYPADGDDLSGRVDLSNSSASMWATRDPFTTRDQIDRTSHLLPPLTNISAIQGGNHSQYGDYGLQERDNTATITQDDQLQIIITRTTEQVLAPMRRLVNSASTVARKGKNK